MRMVGKEATESRREGENHRDILKYLFHAKAAKEIKEKKEQKKIDFLCFPRALCANR
jgi:hypothetical protein